MNKAQALWKTTRPLNLLIMALTMWGVYGAIIAQLDGINSDHGLFSLFTLSIVLLGAGGNVINDIVDVEVDAINKPGVNQVGICISRDFAQNFYWALSTLGALFGLYVSWELEEPLFAGITLFIATSLWGYSNWAQKKVLIGNLIIAILCALLPYSAVVFPMQYLTVTHISWIDIGEPPEYVIPYLTTFNILVFYTSVALVLTLAREIIKDLEDMKGDAKFSRKTLAIVLGPAGVRLITIALLLTVISLIFLHLSSWSRIFPNRLVLIMFCLINFVPVAISVIHTFRLKSLNDIRIVSRWLKISMALGISTTVFFWFI